jgi:hypothetical protein
LEVITVECHRGQTLLNRFLRLVKLLFSRSPPIAPIARVLVGGRRSRAAVSTPASDHPCPRHWKSSLRVYAPLVQSSPPSSPDPHRPRSTGSAILLDPSPPAQLGLADLLPVRQEPAEVRPVKSSSSRRRDTCPSHTRSSRICSPVLLRPA